ncbi:hypothetical protein ACWEV9_31175 [Streptomyces albogriseolus]|uniref:hypothetical protein n=1 Tax=Streptomyces albogriseolus TaxID=1887 RepID=UPI00345FE267
MLALTGTPVLLTYSNLLRQSLAGVVHALGPADRPVRVMTAHRWLAEWYGATPPGSDDGWYDWGALFDRAADLMSATGPTLVVDEGQDLPSWSLGRAGTPPRLRRGRGAAIAGSGEPSGAAAGIGRAAA